MKLLPKARDALLLYFLAAASWAVTPSYGGDPVLCPTYIAFSVDASGSITLPPFNSAWNAIKASISGAVDPTGLLHLAALNFYTYSGSQSTCRSTVVVPGWSTQKDALTALTSLPFFDGVLGCTACAVEQASRLFFNASVLSDPTAVKILFAFTDGDDALATCTALLQEQVPLATARGITTVAVGLGPSLNYNGLALLAGGDLSRVELLKDFNTLPRYVVKPAYCRVSVQCQNAIVCSPIFTQDVANSLLQSVFPAAANVTYSINGISPLGQVLKSGANVVTVRADNGHQTGSCTATVTVDANSCCTTTPIVASGDNVTVDAPLDQCGATVQYNLPTVTGNCTAATLACVPGPGSLFAVGNTTVTCTATDAAGNTGSSSFLVTVRDTTAPDISSSSDITVNASLEDCGSIVTYPLPTVTDNCLGATVSCTPAYGSRFPVGRSTATCTATDAAQNTAQSSFSVTVKDNQPPVFVPAAPLAPVNNTFGSCSAPVKYSLPTATDNCGLLTPAVTCTPAPGSLFFTGTSQVNCTATDTNGNTNMATLTVVVKAANSCNDNNVCTQTDTCTTDNTGTCVGMNNICCGPDKKGRCGACVADCGTQTSFVLAMFGRAGTAKTVKGLAGAGKLCAGKAVCCGPNKPPVRAVAGSCAVIPP